MIVIVIGVAIVIGGMMVIGVSAAACATSVLNVGGGELGSSAVASGATAARPTNGIRSGDARAFGSPPSPLACVLACHPGRGLIKQTCAAILICRGYLEKPRRHKDLHRQPYQLPSKAAGT